MDIRYLQCLNCSKSHFQYVSPNDYAGHYIILINYNIDTKIINYLDPASSSSKLFIFIQ